jgi:hypothetical protein
MAHTLILSGKQEEIVRAFIYEKLLGETGTFVLFFSDLKFSDPLALCAGDGFVTYGDQLVRYEVGPVGTVLVSEDRRSLVRLVVDALDFYL